jgi:hypothetical protein
MFVFLAEPEDGDLRDVIPVDPESDVECTIHESPDAEEIGRRRAGSSTCLYWRPREPIVRYALYAHQQSWSSPARDAQTTLYTEMRCGMRTGILALDMVAPVTVEAAVVFKHPRWRRLATERSLVKYALAQIDSAPLRPAIRDNRQRVEWRVVAPRIGDRYICIAFTAEGLADWQQRLDATSVTGRMRGLFGARRAA